MGAWGAGLYANDCTCDVRDTYLRHLRDQFSNDEAYQKTIEEYHEYIGDVDEPLLWYALADTQWRLGRLMPEVKVKALGWITQNGGIAPWGESKNGAAWKRTLEKLRQELETDMPIEKKIIKPVEFVHNPWNVGDVYVYQFHTDESRDSGLWGKYIPLQKIADEEGYDETYDSRIQIIDKVFDELPTLDDLSGIRILPFDYPDYFLPKGTNDCYPLVLNRVVSRYKRGDYQEKDFTFIGNQPDIAKFPRENSNVASVGWCTFFREEKWLCEIYKKWRVCKYEIREGKAFVSLI